MHTLHRLLRHWYLSNRHGHHLFSSKALQHFDTILQEGMQRHQARLRLVIEVALPARAVLRKISARTRAGVVFAQHHVTHHDASCNVLIYINLADRKVEIITDTETGQSLSEGPWRLLCDQITAGFMVGDPVDGVAKALHGLNAHFLEQRSTTNN